MAVERAVVPTSASNVSSRRMDVLGCAIDTQRYSVDVGKLSSDEARRIGKAIARITEFMMPRQGFYSRVGAPTARTMSTWKTRYIREHWDDIYAPSQG
jgi:hypothetical protein